MFFFFKWVRISSEIDWYHYQGASPASNFDKDPYEVKCHIRAQCGGGVQGHDFLDTAGGSELGKS